MLGSGQLSGSPQSVEKTDPISKRAVMTCNGAAAAAARTSFPPEKTTMGNGKVGREGGEEGIVL